MFVFDKNCVFCEVGTEFFVYVCNLELIYGSPSNQCMALHYVADHQPVRAEGTST